MTTRLVTALLLGGALLLHVVFPAPDPERVMAESLLGPAHRVDLPDSTAFSAGEGALLFFETTGMDGGPIRGAILLDGDRLREVFLLECREGLHNEALHKASFVAAFIGRSSHPPVTVEAVTGATISSRIVLDAINERLSAWHKWRGEK